MAKKDTNDKYTQLKEQIENMLDFADKVVDINPDHEMNFAGNDIYVAHVEHVLEEVKELMDNIESGKAPYYTKEWVKKTLKETEDNYC
jgi:hypothetical protein